MFRCLLFLLPGLMMAQSFNADDPFPFVDELPDDTSRVVFINENFYPIYSASFQNARELTDWAVGACITNNWKSTEAYSRMYRGVVLYLMGEYEAVQPDFITAYELYDSLDMEIGKAIVANEMAVYYRKMGDWERSFGLLDESEKIALQYNELGILGKSYGIRATSYWIRKEYEKSKPYYLKAYDIRVMQKDTVGLGYVLLDLADIARIEGDLAQSLRYVDESIAMRKQINDRQGIIESIEAKAYMYFEEGYYQEAIKYLHQVLEMSAEMGYVDQQRRAFEMMADASKRLGQYKSAYEYQSRSFELKDSLFTIEKVKAINDLQTRYETEKKEQQLEIQNARIEQQQLVIQRDRFIVVLLVVLSITIVLGGFIVWYRMRMKHSEVMHQVRLRADERRLLAVVNSQENERQRFSRDMHDTFGQLISVLNLNLQSIQKSKDHQPSQSELLAESTSVLDDMYAELKNICFDLMPQSLTRGGLTAALEELTRRINHAGNTKINLEIVGMESRIPSHFEVNIFRIVQEWVNNILKHSDASEIMIQLTRDGLEIDVMIEDNGSGFDVGVFENSSGNGWRNINARCNLIGGDLELDSRAGHPRSSLIVSVELPES